jgi:hypothetical protein
MVARSLGNEVTAISDKFRLKYILAIDVQTPESMQKGPTVRMSGSVIDCSSVEGMVRISLYSCNGERVWSNKGTGLKTILPAHLSRGIYLMEVNGPTGNVNRDIIKVISKN